MTDQQKARYRELNRKTAAAKCLESKKNEIEMTGVFKSVRF